MNEATINKLTEKTKNGKIYWAIKDQSDGEERYTAIVKKRHVILSCQNHTITLKVDGAIYAKEDLKDYGSNRRIDALENLELAIKTQFSRRKRLALASFDELIDKW